MSLSCSPFHERLIRYFLQGSRDPEHVGGVWKTFGVIENVLESRPDLASVVVKRTSILEFLLQRLKQKAFDSNKLYASEILSILCQQSADNCSRLGELTTLDGMDYVLQICSYWRRRDPECVCSCVWSLCATCFEFQLRALAGHRRNKNVAKTFSWRFVPCLSMEAESTRSTEFAVSEAYLQRAGSYVLFTWLCVALQDKFRHAEGFELMVRTLQEAKYAAHCALKVLKFATAHSAEGCERLIAVNGLKFVFPVLMGRGLKKQKKAYQVGRSPVPFVQFALHSDWRCKPRACCILHRPSLLSKLKMPLQSLHLGRPPWL